MQAARRSNGSAWHEGRRVAVKTQAVFPNPARLIRGGIGEYNPTRDLLVSSWRLMAVGMSVLRGGLAEIWCCTMFLGS